MSRRVQFVFGIPDDRVGQINLEQINQGISLPGNMPIMHVLAEPLLNHGWQAGFAYLGQPTTLNMDNVDVIINCICDASIQQRSLMMLQELAEKTGLPVLNKVAAVRQTQRDRLGELLLPGEVLLPQTSRFNPALMSLQEVIKQRQQSLPLLARPVGCHGSRGLQLLESANQFRPSPGNDWYYLTDFIDYQDDDGYWRKYRYIWAGGKVFQRHLIIDQGWQVDLASRQFMAGHSALVEEEKRFLAGEEVFDTAMLADMFMSTGLDYAVLDCGRDSQGRLVVFEMNGCFQVTGSLDKEEDKQRWGYLEDNNAAISEAIIAAIAGINK